MDALPASIEHKLDLFLSPPNSATSRLDNLSEIFEFLNTHLFGAIPSLQRAAFLKSLSKPLTSGILNHLLIPTLPTSLSGLPKYLELLERAVKFESEDLTRILFGPSSGASTGTEICPESEIKSWAEDIVSHYQRKRRVDILDQARRMYTDVSSDWHVTFQVEWSVSSGTPAPSASSFVLPELLASSSATDHSPIPSINRTNDVNKEVEIEPVDDEGWGFDDDGGADGAAASPSEEVKESPNEDASPSLTDTADEVDNDAWGWNDEEDPEPTPVPNPEAFNESKANRNAEGGAGGDDPLWDAWDDTPPSPPTKKVVPKPATKLEKFSSKGKQGTKPPKIITRPPEPEPIHVPANTSTHLDPNYAPVPASSTSLSGPWSSSSSTASQQFQSIPPTPASITAEKQAPKEFYSVSSGMQDILELVESTMLESSEFSRSISLAAYFPAPNSASSTSGSTPGSVILNTIVSILDLFRALYPMTLHLELESGGGPQKGTGKSAVSENSTKKAIQFSNDCLYLEQQVQELLLPLPSGSSQTSTTVPLGVWSIDNSLRSKVEDAGKRVKVYGESWFAKTIVCHPSLPFQSQILWLVSGEAAE